MINIEFNNKKINIEYITVKQWMQIMRWDLTEPDNWDRIIEIVLDEYVLFDNDQKELLISLIIAFIKHRKECKLIDFEKMTFGNFVDLEVYLSQGYQNNLDKIMDILSPYTKRIDEALYVFERWATWRDFIFKQYKGLFSISDSEEESETPSHINPSTMVMKNWYKIIVDLAGGDILKIDLITDQPYRKVFNFMAHQKEQIMIANMEQKKKQRQYELQRNRR